jgi:sec-independent protein translocase protein TatB
MFNVGGGEILVILLLALIVLGPDKLPDAAKKVGKVMGDLRRMSDGFKQEMRQVTDFGDDTAPGAPNGPYLVGPSTTTSGSTPDPATPGSATPGSAAAGPQPGPADATDGATPPPADDAGSPPPEQAGGSSAA